ncbi:pyrroline-5-carboxylate reductase [Streptomyces sp. NBC_00102]|uniref:pyrroline-5-carboxylate reductase family protein n=1 Tax=Streptomyces sp. NBC_00102 TaxID=2975652 RepID=UPI00225C2E86|nr:pyrroline-5-carboxylate reductase dimerization domain-containing protein [Streptomyces sp. NBC_00102]MCX5400300.1 NAD(P)-binding domain-containing protein [Streptomyces sp. NBC_00102]
MTARRSPADGTVALVGCGRMARALVHGLLGAGHSPEQLTGVSRTGRGARALAEEYGIRSADTVAEAVHGAAVVVLAVHPHETAAALDELAEAITPQQLLLSLVASWQTEALAARLPGVPVVRAVPNVAVAERDGVTVLGTTPDRTALDTACGLFSGLGQVLVLDEDLLEAVSALSGAGPALVARFAEALASAGRTQGIPAGTADLLAVRAVRSTGSLLAGGATPALVINSVASPGGMTEVALGRLDEGGLAESVREGVDAAVRLSCGRLNTAGVRKTPLPPVDLERT